MRLAALLLLVLLLAGCAAGPAPGAAPEETATARELARLAEGPTRAQEPHIAARGELVIVAAQEMVLDAVTGAERFVIHVHRSDDGGATWTRAILPQRDILAEVDPTGRLTDSGDAVLAFSPDGALYLAGVAATPIALAPGISTLADLTTFVTRSDDGGATWSPALYHADGIGPAIGFSADKPWIVVAPDGRLHLVYTRFVQPFTFLRHASSDDGGATWTPERTIASGDVLDLGQLNGATLAAPGGGRLYLSAMDVHPLPANPLSGTRTRQLAWTSDDDGASWSAPQVVANAIFPRYGAVFADAGEPARAYVAVSDEDGRMLLRATSDGGATWEAPIALAGARGAGQQLPSGYVDADGRAHVAFYDAAWPGGERVVLASIEDGAVVAEQPAPGPTIAPGLDRREYLGLAGDGTRAYAAWVGGDQLAGSTFIDVARFDVEG